MTYYFNKTFAKENFEEVIQLVTKELKKEGFGVLTEIDVKKTLKKKLGVDMKKYRILGACNPHFAHEALQKEDKLGVLLPCNVIIQELDNGDIEVSAVDPIASMGFVGNAALKDIAYEVQKKLIKVMDSMS